MQLGTTKYLENLRQYKADTEHKKVYAWFDNSEKNPASRAQHITSLPDSIDIVGLMCPSELATFEKEEIVTLRQKGTKVVYAISYDEIKAQYENLISTQLELDIETAYWITTDAQEYDKCGIAIDNIQNDYYQTNGNYHNVKETINIMNPAPSK